MNYCWFITKVLHAEWNNSGELLAVDGHVEQAGTSSEGLPAAVPGEQEQQGAEGFNSNTQQQPHFNNQVKFYR